MATLNSDNQGIMKETSVIPQSLISDARHIIEEGRRKAYAAASLTVVETNWKLGQRIVEEEQQGNARAEYGKKLLSALSNELTKEYGAAYSEKNLRNYRQFYLSFKDIEIWNARVPNLTWTHFRIIMRESSPEGRAWYVKEASEQMWSTRTLDRNVSTQYYGRMLAAQRESLALPAPDIEKADPLEYIKNPVVAEFLGFRKDTNEEIARYSVLKDSDQLFAAQYMTYMPTVEELRREIEQQKRFFLEQHS